MPLLSIKKIGDTSIALWEISESIDGLLYILRNKTINLEHLNSFSNENRKKEWLACRAALATISDEVKLIITYDDNNKPHLRDYNISFSHSKNIAAAIISKNDAISIDVEKFSEKVLRIKHKFLNENELEMCKPPFEMEKSILIWSAKESIFKFYSKGNLDFIKNISINDFDFDHQGEFEGRILKNDIKKILKIFYEKHSSFMLTYIIEENIL